MTAHENCPIGAPHCPICCELIKGKLMTSTPETNAAALDYGRGKSLGCASVAFAEALEEERNELRKDALRYRWLRKHSTQPGEPWSTHKNPESMDAAIDEAIAISRESSPNSPGNLGKPDKPVVTPTKPDQA